MHYWVHPPRHQMPPTRGGGWYPGIRAKSRFFNFFSEKYIKLSTQLGWDWRTRAPCFGGPHARACARWSSSWSFGDDDDGMGMTSAGRRKKRGEGVVPATLKAILCPSFKSVFWTRSEEEDLTYSSEALFHFILTTTLLLLLHHSIRHLSLVILFENFLKRQDVCKKRQPRPHWSLLKPPRKLSTPRKVSIVEKRKQIFNLRKKNSLKIEKMNSQLDPTGLY